MSATPPQSLQPKRQGTARLEDIVIDTPKPVQASPKSGTASLADILPQAPSQAGTATLADIVQSPFGSEQFTPDLLDSLLPKYNLTKGSGTRTRAEQDSLIAQGKTKAKNSNHLWGNARDIKGGSDQQRRQFAEFIRDTYGSNIKELYYKDIAIKDGQPVNPVKGHDTHVHLAWHSQPARGVGAAGEVTEGKTASTASTPTNADKLTKAVPASQIQVRKLTPKPVDPNLIQNTLQQQSGVLAL